MSSQICESFVHSCKAECMRMFMCVCVCLRVHVFDLRVEYLGMSHHSLMFPFSSAGTLELLLADLFASCEVPVMHSQSKVTDL